jgi:hypothetical protein
MNVACCHDNQIENHVNFIVTALMLPALTWEKYVLYR